MKKPKLAASISVDRCDGSGGCDCRYVHIRLHDRSGAIFAAAQMPLDTATTVSSDLVAAIQAQIADLGWRGRN